MAQAGDTRDEWQRLLATPGWQTDRFQKPVLILGALDGCMTGVRQLRRARPLAVAQVSGLKVPELAEMARVKAWLFLSRHSTRDLLDTVALLEKLGEDRLRPAFLAFDEIYERGPEGGPPLVELTDRMAAAQPADRPEIDLKAYKGVVPPWDDWRHLEARSRSWATRLAAVALEPPEQA